MPARWSTRGVTGQNGLTESHVALTPKGYKLNSLARRGAISAHGSAGSSLSALTAGAGADIANALVDAGFPVLSADNGGPTTWGNDTCIARMGDAVTSLNTAFGAKADKVLLVGTSMGAPCVLNWARTHTSQVAAIVLIVPCVDIADIHDNNRGNFTAEIETAYVNFAGYTAGLPTHNPTAFAATFAGIPMQLYYSTNDPIATPAAVTAFVTAVGGTAASSVPIGANGHGLGSWNPADAASFFLPYI